MAVEVAHLSGFLVAHLPIAAARDQKYQRYRASRDAVSSPLLPMASAACLGLLGLGLMVRRRKAMA